MRSLADFVLRAALPIAILAGGWYGFSGLLAGVEEKPRPTAPVAKLRTRVQELEVIDYRVVVKTHATVQPHNRVALSAEVAGAIAEVSPLFEVGAYFKKGDLLVRIDRRDYETALAIARSQLAAAESALKLARLNEERKLRLIESNAVSRAEVDTASAGREQAEADVALARTQVEQAELNLARTEVTAPFDGRVATKTIGAGQMVATNTSLGEVFAVDYAEVRLPISGPQRRYLRLPEFTGDSPVDVTLRDGIDPLNDATWRARIVRTEGVLDEDSRDLIAIARIDDPFGQESAGKPLRIGQPVNAFIEGELLTGVVALPRAAVRQLDRVILVSRADSTLRPLTVEPLWSDERHVVVAEEELPEDAWLATTPLTYTPEGAPVEIIPEANPVAESPAKPGNAAPSSELDS